jgi:hypothetical protein
MAVDNFNRFGIRDSHFEGRDPDYRAIFCVQTKHYFLMVPTEDLMDQPPSRNTRPERTGESTQRSKIATLDDEGEEQ